MSVFVRKRGSEKRIFVAGLGRPGPPGPGGESGDSPGVASFNGRSGAVQPLAGDYTAEMVGARPATWIPTADEVGALPAGTAIPSKTSHLINDSGFVTSTEISDAIKAAILDSWEGSY